MALTVGNLRLEPLSPPAYSRKQECCSRFAEGPGGLYHIRWKGDWVALHIDDHELISIDLLEQSIAYSQVMNRTTLLSYGAECQIRAAIEPEQFSVYKLVMPNDLPGRATIAHEYQILQSLQPHNLTVQVGITHSDEGGVFGYSMQRLESVPRCEMLQRFDEIRAIVTQLHALGIIHGDLSSCNLMKAPCGKLVMIDFGWSGKMDEPLPSDNLWRRHRGETVFSAILDLVRLDEIRTRLTAEAARNDIDGRVLNLTGN